MKRVRYYFFAVLLSLITVFALVQPPKPVYASCAEGATKCSGTSVYICEYPTGWVYLETCKSCCSGGKCTGTVPYCSSSLSCKCGCTKSCSGGVCKVCPTATNTPKPPTPTSSCLTHTGQWCSDFKSTCTYDDGCAGIGTCYGGYACCKVCPTSTPTSKPTPTTLAGTCTKAGQECVYGACSSVGKCMSPNQSCLGGLACCENCSNPTATKTPTKTPTPTKKINSCTGATDCTVQVYEIPNECSCVFNNKKYVYTECKDLFTGLIVPCTDTNGCQTSTTCNVTPTANPTVACNNLNSSSCVWYAQNDCGGSSCGCGERRTALLRCYGVHCADTCAVDKTCTNECTVTPTTSGGGGGGGGTTGTLTAKAVTVSKTDTSCLAIQDSTNYLDGTLISFSPSVGSKTQTIDGILTWPGVDTGTYTISGVAPASYALGNVCVSSNESAYSQLSSGALTSAGTLSFIMGYIPQNGWVQTVAGNVYAANTLISSIPTTATNAYFSLAGAMGAVGMVTYGVNYDFSLDTSTLGETMISTKNWLIKQAYTSTDFYAQFATRLDIPAAAKAITATDDLSAFGLCTSSPCLLYMDGSLITSSTQLTIPGDRKEVLFVNGNMKINGNIVVDPGGFLALIVHGNVTIDPTVTTVQGIIIATNQDHTATFSTEMSGEQLVVTGSVIADNFSLLRDLGSTVNSTTPAERFIFNPEFLFTMPDTMKEIPYIWQEVAP